MGCAVSSSVDVWQAPATRAAHRDRQQRIEQAAQFAHIRHGNVTREELRMFLARPAVSELLAELRGARPAAGQCAPDGGSGAGAGLGSTSGEAHVDEAGVAPGGASPPPDVAAAMLEAFDADHTGALSRTQVSRLVANLERAAGQSFYVWVTSHDVGPGDDVTGVVVLHLDEPLVCTEVVVTLRGDMAAHCACVSDGLFTFDNDLNFMGVTVILATPDKVLEPGSYRYKFRITVSGECVTGVGAVPLLLLLLVSRGAGCMRGQLPPNTPTSYDSAADDDGLLHLARPTLPDANWLCDFHVTYTLAASTRIAAGHLPGSRSDVDHHEKRSPAVPVVVGHALNPTRLPPFRLGYHAAAADATSAVERFTAVPQLCPHARDGRGPMPVLECTVQVLEHASTPWVVVGPGGIPVYSKGALVPLRITVTLAQTFPQLLTNFLVWAGFTTVLEFHGPSVRLGKGIDHGTYSTGGVELLPGVPRTFDIGISVVHPGFPRSSFGPVTARGEMFVTFTSSRYRWSHDDVLRRGVVVRPCVLVDHLAAPDARTAGHVLLPPLYDSRGSAVMAMTSPALRVQPRPHPSAGVETTWTPARRQWGAGVVAGK